MKLTSNPGDNLAMLLTACGVPSMPGCDCEEWVAKMNSWGPDGCREHRQELIDMLSEKAFRLSAKKIVSSFVRAIFNGVRPTVASLVDCAISAAEKTA